MGRRGFGGRLAIGFVLAAAMLVGPACKKKAAKPPEPGTGEEAARPDGGSPRQPEPHRRAAGRWAGHL